MIKRKMARPNNIPETMATGSRQPGGGIIFNKISVNFIIK
jgi:hypothetical protein